MARILIVDDARVMRMVLRAMLEKAGHEVVGEATDGVEAVQMYGELNPDLVTMDIQMKNGNGLTSLEQIMLLDPEAKVIVVSALHCEKESEARHLGAVGYLDKPFQADDLMRQTQIALAQS